MNIRIDGREIIKKTVEKLWYTITKYVYQNVSKFSALGSYNDLRIYIIKKFATKINKNV